MKPTDSGLATLIEDIRRVHPNPDGTFAEVLMYLRELQRIRAGIPKRITSWSQAWYEGDGTPVDSPIEGWNACVDAMERVMKGDAQ